jgi:uncharacterized protein
VTLFYADSSALVKIVREEPESSTLRAYFAEADIVSCELVLAELPRAIRRAVALDPRLSLERLIEQAGEVIDAIGLIPIDRPLLLASGALAEPALRTLDATHVAAAVEANPLDAFVTYDERQAAAARLAGLRTIQPGT